MYPHKTDKQEKRALTFSALIQCSTRPSCDGTNSLMLNFCDDIFTSGVTSHPGIVDKTHESYNSVKRL